MPDKARVQTAKRQALPAGGLKASRARCLDRSRSETNSIPRPVPEALKTPGYPLPLDVRAAMEDRLGHDFSRVRVHADEKAAASALSVGALAFAHGRDLVFGRGQYRPETEPGRELLAHELGHLAEHGGFVPFLARATPASTAPGQAAVKTALQGDDDDVRALTESPQWPVVTLTRFEAAQLIMHLLEGFTGDDDEVAGLKILQKMLSNKELDATLGVLHSEGKFGDLIDDYHGEEYCRLLDLLSESLKETSIKAVFLDQFVAMWWVREYEEKAIVVLLEQSSPDEVYELLTQRNRYLTLRSAIDTEDYSRRFEKQMKKVNLKRGENLRARVETIFMVEAEKSLAAKTRTEEEVQDLFFKATFDLARELIEWRTELEAALKNRSKSASDIAEINKRFEARLDRLIDDKRQESRLELKYNLEFNRSLRKGFRQAWTVEDLKFMDDEILSKIPPEILHAKPDFSKFYREREHPKFSGQASSREGRITLAGELSLRTTIHELGHMVHFDDKDLFRRFRALSSWEELDAKFFTDNNLEDLRADLESDRANNRKYDRRSNGEYYYRYQRYQDDDDPPMYWRYPQSSCFISDYAATDPMDDFADTFEEYFVEPANLANKCPWKYDFIHHEVFIKYWLRKEVGRLKKAFEDECGKLLAGRTESWRLLNPIRQKYIDVFRSSMLSGLETIRAQKVAESEHGGLMEPVPLKGYKALEQKAAPYLERLVRLLDLIRIPLLRYSDFAITREMAEYIFVEARLQSTHKTVVDRLSQEFADELLALIYPLAQRISRGQKVEKKGTWPEVDAIAEKYRKASGVIESYLPNYKAMPLRGNFYFQEWIQASQEFPPGPVFNKVDQYIQDQDLALTGDLQALEAEMDRRMKAGIAFKASEVADPRKLVKKYHDLVISFKRKMKKK